MKKLSVSNFLVFVMIVMYILIIFSGSNIFNRFQELYFLGIFLITILLSLKKKIIFDKISLLLIFQLIFLVLTSIYSIDFQASMTFIIIYALCTFISIFYYDNKTSEKLLKVIEVFSLISALIIIISIVKKDLIITNFSFLFPNQAAFAVTLNEIKYNIFSGFALERGYAAFGINLGIISIISRFCASSKKDKKDYIKLFILIIALFSCGKRTLLIIPIFIFIVILFLNDSKKFAGNIIKYFLIGTIALSVLSNFVPTVNTLLDRFLNVTTDSSYNGRTNYWNYSFQMYKENPMLGKGINTYPTYLKNNGNLKVYHAHNIYIQFLGEIGILGFLIFVFSFFSILIITITFYRRNYRSLTEKQKYIVNYSICMQLLFTIYGLTGNTFYYFDQLIIYFLAINILKSIQCEVKKNEKNRNYNIS